MSVLTEGHAPSQLRDSGGLGESLTALSSCYHPRVGGSDKRILLYCLPFNGPLPGVIALLQQLRAPLLNSVESWVGGENGPGNQQPKLMHQGLEGSVSISVAERDRIRWTRNCGLC